MTKKTTRAATKTSVETKGPVVRFTIEFDSDYLGENPVAREEARALLDGAIRAWRTLEEEVDDEVGELGQFKLEGRYATIHVER